MLQLHGLLQQQVILAFEHGGLVGRWLVRLLFLTGLGPFLCGLQIPGLGSLSQVRLDAAQALVSLLMQVGVALLAFIVLALEISELLLKVVDVRLVVFKLLLLLLRGLG